MPVGLQVDSYYLYCFTIKIQFGGYFVAMYGYDDAHAYLVDTAQQDTLSIGPDDLAPSAKHSAQVIEDEGTSSRCKVNGQRAACVLEVVSPPDNGDDLRLVVVSEHTLGTNIPRLPGSAVSLWVALTAIKGSLGGSTF